MFLVGRRTALRTGQGWSDFTFVTRVYHCICSTSVLKYGICNDRLIIISPLPVDSKKGEQNEEFKIYVPVVDI